MLYATNIYDKRNKLQPPPPPPPQQQQQQQQQIKQTET